jgi:hypothetical protein
VNVIRHHYPSKHAASLSIKAQQGALHESSEIRLAQDTTAVAAIEPSFGELTSLGVRGESRQFGSDFGLGARKRIG